MLGWLTAFPDTSIADDGFLTIDYTGEKYPLRVAELLRVPRSKVLKWFI